ncbi:hypothetical protein O3Q51_05965 [Cryomorphaceae bacterium 1068]|nr:hypothetical protein [Cryomorphaceae bacterium 1068]
MSNNVCECPNPPGGTVICEPDQLAICHVKDGKAIQRCLDPVDSMNPYVIINWTLNRILDREFKPRSKRTIKKYIKRLEAGNLTTIGGTKVSFSLPKTVQKALNQIKNDRSNPDKPYLE